jgi:hypothetical protein
MLSHVDLTDRGLCTAAILMAQVTHAQQYPTTYSVTSLGQPAVIMNRPGAAGIIAAQAIAKAVGSRSAGARTQAGQNPSFRRLQSPSGRLPRPTRAFPPYVPPVAERQRRCADGLFPFSGDPVVWHAPAHTSPQRRRKSESKARGAVTGLEVEGEPLGRPVTEDIHMAIATRRSRSARPVTSRLTSCCPPARLD